MDYVVNYDYISQVLCINQDKPELECNGKCALMESIEQSAKDEQKEPGVVKSEFQLLYLQDYQNLGESANDTIEKRIVIFTTENNYNYSSPFSLLRPPIL